MCANLRKWRFKAFFNLLVTKFQGYYQVFCCLKVMFYKNKITSNERERVNRLLVTTVQTYNKKWVSNLKWSWSSYSYDFDYMKNERSMQKSLYHSQRKSDYQNMENVFSENFIKSTSLNYWKSPCHFCLHVEQHRVWKMHYLFIQSENGEEN